MTDTGSRGKMDATPVRDGMPPAQRRPDAMKFIPA
jgi:hypothetical protein